MPRSKKPDEEANKVMDVAKPGKTAPDASSRPLIVGHQPMVKDPMMSNPTAPADDLEQKEDQKSITSHTGLTIQPGSSADTTLDSKDQTETTPELGDKLPPAPTTDNAPILPDSFMQENTGTPEQKPEPIVQDTVPPPEQTKPPELEVPTEPKAEDIPKPSEPQPDQADPDESSAEPSGDDAAAVDAVASEAGAKKQPTGPTEAENAKQAALEKAIASKQYFVPISRTKSRGVSHMITVALVVVLLLAVAVELAIDAGVLNVGVPPVIDLIK